MQRTTEFLNPRRKLVDEVVDWLCARIERDATGTRSLAHLIVVVPTAQSGRSLRLRLAQKIAEQGPGGVLPPQVMLPMQLIAPVDAGFATATPVQLRAVFLRFIATRPRRRVIDGRTILDEWQTLFRPEYIGDVKSHLSFFDQLTDIWRILAGGGLLMRDVAQVGRAQAVLAAAAGDESARWQALGEFETAYFDELHACGLRHEVEAIHLAKTAAEAIPQEIREVVLPALADPVSVVYEVLQQQRDDLKVTVLLHADTADTQKFDAWGRPLESAWVEANAPVLEGVRTADVVRAATDTELAKFIAADFPPVETDLAVPSLGLCDEELYPELTAAFLNKGYELHNPERHPLASSSLGHLVDALVTVYDAREKGMPWETLATLLRLDDVLERLLTLCGKDENGRGPRRSRVLEGLDIFRNTFLPHELSRSPDCDVSRLKSFQKPVVDEFLSVAKTLYALADASAAESSTASGFVRGMLRRIYDSRTVDADAKEFRVAAERLQSVLAQFEDDVVVTQGLPEGAMTGLLRKAVAEASYSLEPDSKTALKTEGWLELAWSASDKIALAGFNEGVVPDAVVGHAFLPDTLRAALGLVTNTRRLARDTFLFSDLLRARAGSPGSVRVYVSQANNAGDLHRPSRLLFLVAPEQLAERAKGLFGDLPPPPPRLARTLAAAWRPRLPDALPMPGMSADFPDGRLSASAIDTWLKCPFCYLLKNGVNVNRVEEKTELGADDFGLIVHRALELYAREQLERTAKGLAQLHEEDDIVAALVRIMAGISATYGSDPCVNLRLQLDAVLERLKCFARIQAKWAQDGWVVKAEPEYGFFTRPFAGEGDCDVPVKGYIDRIDWKEGVGYRLIDYKTWDKRADATGRILKGGAEELGHAARLKLPVLGAGEAESKRKRFLTVQLPLYGRCLEKYDPAAFAGQIADYCYVLLGATPEDAVVLGSAFDQMPYEAVKRGKIDLASHVELALETARAAIRRIRGNFFWPPGPSETWRWDIKDLLSVSPEADFPMGTAWRDAQELKLAALQDNAEEVRA